MVQRLRRLMPSQEALQRNRWLRWLGPGLFHPRLWHMSRRGIALGVAIGVFFAFLIPIAQIPLSAALAVALRANIPAAVASTLVNNPLTFPPVYYAAWKVGSWMLGEEADPADAPALPDALEMTGVADGAANGRGFWRRTIDGLQAVGKPLLVGAVTFACVFGALAYFAVNGLWHLNVRLKRRARQRRAESGRAG
ncbi:MAG: DUF2062 domain-containing protein [Rubrivivax sp.]|nr:DUF2062 domain-containing protein [Rubrivivax sp.]